MARIILKSAIFFAVIALLLMTHKSAAAGPTESKDLVCKNGRHAIGDLGITKLSFKGTIISRNLETGETDWYFQSEPKIGELDENGPAARKIKSGDAIVAIGGFPITTRKGGQLFANLPPGDPVELTLRRDGRIVKASVTPRAVCPEDHPMRFGLHRTSEVEAEVIDAVSSYLEALSKVHDIDVDLPELPERPEPPERRALGLVPELGHSPRAWFGMSIECHECRITIPKKGGVSHWRFDSPPEIDDIVPGGPAERAGLEPGDVLTHIDGIPIEDERGGQRFSSIEPGDTVRWTFRRGEKTKTVTMIATDRPDLEREREQAWEKARQEYGAALDALHKTREDARRTLELSHAEQESVARSAWELAAAARELGFTLLFSDTFEKGDIEVRGDDSVNVAKDERSGEILIRTRDATIRVRPSPKKK